MHNVPKSNIIGFTGVRFNEVIRNVAELARLFDNVSDFILYQPKDSLFRKEFEELSSHSNYESCQVDLLVLNLINYFYFEPAYRCIVQADIKVDQFKRFLLKTLDVLRLDSEECFKMMTLANNLPFISEYYKPTKKN